MQKLDDAVQKWKDTAEGDGLNQQLIGIADAVYVEKPECRDADAIEDYLLNMGAQRWGNLDDQFRKDCRRAAERAVEAMSEYSYKEENRRTTGEKKTDYVAEREAWHKANAKDTALLEEVRKQDVREDRIRTGTALEALFRHAKGHVWHGATEGVIAEKSWTDTCNVKNIPSGEKFVCTATFGNKLKTGEEGAVYERTNENVQQVAFAVLEMDAPMAGRKYTKEELNALSEEERKAYRGRILEDTCLIIENIGVKPTTITFSGNKSYHCTFRFSKPVDALAWHSRCNELKSAYQRIGADEAMLSLMRCTRMPKGTTRIKAEDDEGQRLMYFDPDAEVDFDDFVDKVASFASQISEGKEEKTDLHLPMEKDKKTGKWKKLPEKRTAFIKTAKVTKVENGDTQRLIVSDERGVFRYQTPQQISDYLVNYVFANAGIVEGEHYADLYKTELAKSTLEYFVAIVRHLNEPLDTEDTVYVPFKNGMLVINSKSAEMKKDDYLGYDIRHVSPTLYRDFEIDMEKSEFETFLERACGSEEDHEFWPDRKKSIMTLIGYMISKHKEGGKNYINVLTEETNAEDSGRTGKGIIATAVKYWRKRCLVDMKQVFGDDTSRWIYTNLDADTDDFMQFDDVRKNVVWEQFYVKAVDDWEIEKKGKDKIIVPKEKAPKMIFTSNFYPKANGGSQKGRMRIFEISNHYSSKHTPYDEFGHFLFDDWDEAEWHRFDTFIAKCVGLYLRNGYLPCPQANMEEKEYEVTVNNNEFKRWFDDREQGFFSDLSKKHRWGEFDSEFKQWFKTRNGYDYRGIIPSDQTIISWVKLYCESHGLVANPDRETKGGRKRYWTFSEIPSTVDVSSTAKNTVDGKVDESQSVNPQDDKSTTSRRPASSPTFIHENKKEYNNIYDDNAYIYKGVGNSAGRLDEPTQNADNQCIACPSNDDVSSTAEKTLDGESGLDDLGAFAPSDRTAKAVAGGQKDPMRESRRIWRERTVADLRAKGMTDIVEEEGRVEFTDPKGRRMEWVHGDTTAFPVGL